MKSSLSILLMISALISSLENLCVSTLSSYSLVLSSKSFIVLVVIYHLFFTQCEGGFRNTFPHEYLIDLALFI